MTVSVEEFDAAVRFANDRAEGGRGLDIVRAKLEFDALQQTRAMNLLALANQVDDPTLKEHYRNQAIAYMEPAPLPEPPAAESEPAVEGDTVTDETQGSEGTDDGTEAAGEPNPDPAV